MESDTPGSLVPVVTDPRLVEAQIKKLNAEAGFFKAQTEKEEYMAQNHKYAALDSKRLFDAQMATNSENRVYDFIGTVSTGTCENAMQTLSRWRRQSSEPITFRISSPGGSLIDGFALYDFILGLRAGGIKITTAAIGMAASAAGILLQAGDERVISPNAHLLIHEISSGAQGKLSELEDETKFFQRLNTRAYEILAERSKLKRPTIETRAKRKDWWLSAEECVDLGFADRIGYVE